MTCTCRGLDSQKGDTEGAGASQGSTKLVTTGGMSMNHLVADAAKKGNGHMGSSVPQAFVLTNTDTYTKEAFNFTLRLGSTSSATRFLFVTKYVDDTHWTFIGYDTGGWLYPYKDGSSER